MVAKFSETLPDDLHGLGVPVGPDILDRDVLGKIDSDRLEDSVGVTVVRSILPATPFGDREVGTRRGSVKPVRTVVLVGHRANIRTHDLTEMVPVGYFDDALVPLYAPDRFKASGLGADVGTAEAAVE